MNINYHVNIWLKHPDNLEARYRGMGFESKLEAEGAYENPAKYFKNLPTKFFVELSGVDAYGIREV